MTKAITARKVAEIRGRVRRVRDLLPGSADEFRAHRTEAEALMLNLYLALQGCSDIAMHVVADLGLGVPADTRGAFHLLDEAGVVPHDLAHRLAGAIGLRNRIAHEYGKLDLDRVFGAARDDLGDLEAFAAAVANVCGLSGV